MFCVGVISVVSDIVVCSTAAWAISCFVSERFVVSQAVSDNMNTAMIIKEKVFFHNKIPFYQHVGCDIQIKKEPIVIFFVFKTT